MKRSLLLMMPVLGLLVTSAALAATVTGHKYRAHISSKNLKGNWALNFGNGLLRVSRNGKAVVSAAYIVRGQRITVAAAQVCKGPGAYEFKIKGKTLTFIRISDSCRQRRLLLSATYKSVT